jgi:hypothetical protein
MISGHELWQHANLKANGLADARLSTPASQGNPVIALDDAMHRQVNAAQSFLDAASMTPRENIAANAQILRGLNAAPPETIDLLERWSMAHAEALGY